MTFNNFSNCHQRHLNNKDNIFLEACYIIIIGNISKLCCNLSTYPKYIFVINEILKYQNDI